MFQNNIKTNFCLESFTQIYDKENKSRRFKHFKNQDMAYTNKIKLAKFSRDLSFSASRIILHALLTMKRDEEDIVETLSLRLDFNKKAHQEAITKNKKSFYAAIDELITEGFLIKHKPKHYLVNPEYHHLMTREDIRWLHNNAYSIVQSFQPAAEVEDPE